MAPEEIERRRRQQERWRNIFALSIVGSMAGGFVFVIFYVALSYLGIDAFNPLVALISGATVTAYLGQTVLSSLH